MREAGARAWVETPQPEPRRSPAAAVTTISRLAELTGATPRALRHYQHEGLLDPIRTASGQRRYRPEDVDRAMTIVWLRALDVSIPDIRDLLDALGPAAARARLHRRLRMRIEALGQARAAAERALALLEGGGSEPFDVHDLRAIAAPTSPLRLAIAPVRAAAD